jgi:hypothetical protein
MMMMMMMMIITVDTIASNEMILNIMPYRGIQNQAGRETE